MQETGNKKMYQQARLSRDARFDGRFFVAVKTTGIYCRPICPANTPKEENIEYFEFAHLAAKSGYRPCLRCHPDSAPDSPIWNGVNTTLKRAKRMIDEGELERGSLKQLATRVGVSDRYLRHLFEKHLGVSAKSYALFRQCEFAKKLLHQTSLPVTEVAFASGFKSIRRFNDCFKNQLQLTPSQCRQSKVRISNKLNLKLYYRPPYHWEHLRSFLASRIIENMEWVADDHYGRTFTWEIHQEDHQKSSQQKCQGKFTATHNEEKHRFDVSIEIDNVSMLKTVISNIRRILDLDTDTEVIEQNLVSNGFEHIAKGLRLPGLWSLYEAGIRAILGQQISVKAAQTLVTEVVLNLGQADEYDHLYFPSPEVMAQSDFNFLKIPQSRKQTLSNLSQHFLNSTPADEAENWCDLKGIGPWTVNYAKMRGLSDPDIYLAGDLGIKKAIGDSHVQQPDNCTPFRSYLTFQLWNTL